LLSNEFFSLSQYTKIDVGAPQIPYSWFQGDASRQEGNGGEGRKGLGVGGEGKGRERGDREGERVKLGGIAPWSLGG